MYVMAKLSEEQLTQLQTLESEQGIKVVAMVDVELAPAAIDAAVALELTQLEKSLGTTLLAVQ